MISVPHVVGHCALKTRWPLPRRRPLTCASTPGLLQSQSLPTQQATPSGSGSFFPRSMLIPSARTPLRSFQPGSPFHEKARRRLGTSALGTERSSSDQIHDFFASGARLTSAAHLMWEQLLQPGDTVVDATCGNGHDTAFLSRAVGPTGLVYGFDIQEAAIASTTRRLGEELPAEQRPHLHLVCGCHSEMLRHVGEGTAALVCFNLGYLPSADKALITQMDTTIAAIEAALAILKPGGMLSVMCYTGHTGGTEEYNSVVSLLGGLPPNRWTTLEHRLVNRPTAPILQLAYKRYGDVQ